MVAHERVNLVLLVARAAHLLELVLSLPDLVLFPLLACGHEAHGSLVVLVALHQLDDHAEHDIEGDWKKLISVAKPSMV